MYASYDQLGTQQEPNRDVMNILEVDENTKKNLISSHQLVCVDIYADWCGPCKQTAPEYAVLASTFGSQGKCAVVKQNYDKMVGPEKGQFKGIPTFQFFMNGKLVDDVIGGDINAVEEKLKKYTTALSNSHSLPQVRETGPGMSGPLYTKNSIRSSRTQIPHMDGSGSNPYQNHSGSTYHQPFQ